MDRLAAAALAFCLLAAGCAGAPAAEEGGALSVSLANEDDVAYTVTVSVVPPDVDGVTVTYENRTERRFDVGSAAALPEGTLRNATAVAADGEGARVETYRLDPESGIGGTYDVPRGSTVVDVVQQGTGPGSVRGVGVGRCAVSVDVTALSVTVRADGSLHTGIECRDRPQGG
jgi:hypothetical protein